jgi:hypothetical protein
VVADFFEHLADFAIAAFDEDHFVPRILGVAQEADARWGGHDSAFIAVGWFRPGAAARLTGRRAGLAADLGPEVDHDAMTELVDSGI